jgi:hypothetical protein
MTCTDRSTALTGSGSVWRESGRPRLTAPAGPTTRACRGPMVQRRIMATRVIGATIAREDRSIYGQAWLARPVRLGCAATGRSHDRVTALPARRWRRSSVRGDQDGIAARWPRYDRMGTLTWAQPDLCCRLTEAQGVQKEAGGWRRLASAGVIEMIAVERLASILQHPHQRAPSDLLDDVVLHHECDAMPRHGRIEHKVYRVKHQLPLDPHVAVRRTSLSQGRLAARGDQISITGEV